ncbi:universal stress protein [Fodinibius sediminis]|uniref:Nucleotide-binding universal stress protein, UspA family n=1 Tax=Fodinibius sediminis TaxID=1214077 RepID=A0A521AYK4_9BACT|nr:universal stress protein [Fodinibius sediminis]SMO39923.1 Nucleotide-binding universal stress protein, UspA family [Fodinibius sediminis]
MKELKTILFPTDFTEDAAQAYTYALKVAARTGATLHLLHVIEEPFDFATRVEETVEALVEQAEGRFETLVSDARADEEIDIQIETHIARGEPYGVINQKAEEVRADLLIMGTKGESSLKRILYGDVTSDVILDTQVPVMTVPVNSKEPYLDRFLFATDFRSKDMEALQATVTLARALDAEVHVLHVSEKKDLDVDLRFRGFKDLVTEKIAYDSMFFHHIEAERFSKGVSNFLEEYPISLIILIRYKKVFLRTLLWANNTQELTYHTHVPMLVYIPESL